MEVRFLHPPDMEGRLPRRRFLGTLIGGAAAVTLPAPARALTAAPRTTPPALPAATDDEAFWTLVKQQFPLRPGYVLMNAANLCPAPYSVSDAATEWRREVDGDASFQNRARFSELGSEAVAGLADLVGADPSEIVITRNTTEGNNTVVGGLDLGPGDQVLLWSQNHPSNSVAWDVGARRYGYEVVRAATPADPRSPDALVAPFREALTSRTRVLAFSHHSNASGVAMPARELCRLAREAGVLTLVDGAQTFGFVDLDLHDMGCDFYTSSTHKWFMGPKEAGLLYVRSGSDEHLWPRMVGVGWEGAQEAGGAARFGTLGQRDDATVASVSRAVDFHRHLGPQRIEARVHALHAALRSGLEARIDGIRFHTPAAPHLSGGPLIFQLPDVEPRAAFQALYDDHRIGCAAMSGGLSGVRLSPHVYNTMEDVAYVVDAVASLGESQ